MSQDHAKRRDPSPGSPLPGWVWFIAGLSLGIFGSFLYFVRTELPTDTAAAEVEGRPAGDAEVKIEEMQWDFYDIFPKSEVPVVEEYGADGTLTQVENPSAYLLQAGSFKNAKDADTLRAELILLGMDVFVREVDNDGTTWHRVLVGPLDSEIELSRHRRKLAEANIPSIALRVPAG